MKLEVFLITKNKHKYLAAKKVFDEYGIKLTRVNSSFCEIQSNSGLDIAKYAAREMHKKLNKNVIREDHSLYLDGLKFPGPYTNYFNKALNENEFLKIIKAFNINSGKMVLAAVLFYKNKCITFQYSVPIKFSKKPKGNLSKGWDRVMMLKWEKRTFAQYPAKERVQVWQKNFKRIAEYIKNN
jgi:non-canonical purine NTP pyrophosphatase (RdgB/HAM1 family)